MNDDLAKQRRTSELENAQHRRLAAIGRVTAGVAHNLNNRIQSILMNAELFGQENELPPTASQRVQRIAEEARHSRELLRRIWAFSSEWASVRRDVDLGALLTRFVDERRLGVSDNIRIELVMSDGELRSLADRAQIERLMENLTANAIEAMPQGGRLTISLFRTVVGADGPAEISGMPEGPWFRLDVADTGTGIPAELLPHIFEPRARVNEPSVGLGLADVRGIVDQHGGYVSVDSEVGRGTTFTVYLPELDDPDARGRAAARPSSDLAGILVAEDDPVVLSIMADALQSEGYRVFQAANGREAVSVYERVGDQVKLVILDVVMPGLGGPEAMARIRKRDPDARVLLMSGYGGTHDLSTPPTELTAVLQKPFTLETLLSKVSRALAREVTSGA